MLRKTDLWVSRGALRQLQGLMPLSEFHYAARSNLDSSQCKQTPALSPDLPSTMSDSDFIELLWENGQIVMQGQSGRPKKPPVASAHPFHSSRFPDKDCGDGVTGRPARPTMLIGSPGGDFAPAMIPGATAAALNSSQEDDMAPWLNYSIDDYYSELLNDFTGANANPLPPGNSGNLGLPDKGTATSSTGLNQIVRDLYDVEPHIPRSLAVTNMSEAGRARSGLVNQLPHQWQNSVQNSRSKPLDFGGAGSSMVTGQSPGCDLPNCAKAPRQEVVCSPKPPVPPTPSTSSGVINFSHFSRPASLLKANLHNASRLRSSEKTSTLITNPMESTLVSSPGAMKSNAQEYQPLISRKPILRPPTPPSLQELAAGTSQSETLSWRDAGVRNASASAAAAATPAKITDKRPPENVPAQRMGSISIMMPPQNAQHGTEKSLETVLAPSSVCSANGGATESIVPSHRAKRKSTEEESGYQSDDVEDESVGGAKKQPTTRTTSSKRSRAAEVHNQSERRRRDRINEKMRALQELIPNCNKVDKASMLDEAIEYLKSLQLQLQIMSMGGGFCMPPMMLPPAMQRLRSPHMAHFPPMGVGMGMGVGYRMGILDINGNPLLPLPPVPSTQFPCSSMGAATGLQSMAPSTTSGHPMFGIPSPGVPVPMHCAPPFVALAPHSAWPNPAPEVVGTATGTAPPVVVDPAGSKDDYQQNMGTETSLRQGGVKQLPPKSQREKERASSPMTNDGASNSDGHTNSCAGNGNSSSGGSYD